MLISVLDKNLELYCHVLVKIRKIFLNKTGLTVYLCLRVNHKVNVWPTEYLYKDKEVFISP